MATAKGKAAAKAAPVEAAEVELTEGMSVTFLGYAPDTPEDEQILTAGEVYEVIGVTAPEGNDPGGNPILRVDNPDFSPKKKEHPDTNPKTLEVEALLSEVELAEEAPADPPAEEAAAVKPAAKTTAKAAAAAKPAAKTATKPAAKTTTKPAAKTAPAKKGAKTAPPPEPEEQEAATDELPDLENESPEVLALVDGVEPTDLIAVAQDLETQVGSLDYQLGGVLFHIKKSKAHLAVEGGEEYAEKGGFGKFLLEYFNVDYRKAMYLIDIYQNFTLAGIENPAEKVAAIGWTKASKISKYMVAEEANPEELLELAENNSVAELSEAIKEQIQVGGTPGTPGDKKTKYTLKFRYYEEEGKTNESILKAAQEQLGVKDLGEALSHILSDWASTNAGGVATAASAPKQGTKAPAVKRATAKA